MDYALMLYFLHHFYNPIQAIWEAYRILKPNGYLIAMVEFKRYPFQERLIHINEISMERIIYGETQKENYTFLPERFLTVGEFERYTKEAGFEPITKKTYMPTRKIDILFKTKKVLYVWKKEESSKLV